MGEMTNEERLKQMGTQELARELSLIAMWDREQLRKAQKGPGLEAFMEKWLREPAVRDLDYKALIEISENRAAMLHTRRDEGGYIHEENCQRALWELLARAEGAEERCKELEDRCKRLNEARERANEAAAKWESAYKIAMGQKEKAEREAEEEERREATLCSNDRKKSECNFEHLYNQTKYMLEKYQDEIIPAFRELLYNREPIDRTPLLKCGDLVEINPERRENKWKKGVVSQVLLCKGDEWVYNITVKHGYPETKNFSCKDKDIGDWVQLVR